MGFIHWILNSKDRNVASIHMFWLFWEMIEKLTHIQAHPDSAFSVSNGKSFVLYSSTTLSTDMGTSIYKVLLL